LDVEKKTLDGLASLVALQTKKPEEFLPEAEDCDALLNTYAGPITAEELETRRERGYLLNDDIGRTGLERIYEQYLRGTNGWRDIERDAAQRELRQLVIQLPTAGGNLVLTLDDRLRYQVSTLPNRIVKVSSEFEGLAGATVGLALRLDGIPEASLVYVAALPGLWRDVGLFEDGKALPHDVVKERLRREILDRAEACTRRAANCIDELTTAAIELGSKAR
jgi:hypothetical protein